MIKVGNELRWQKLGFPMGSALSSGLAVFYGAEVERGYWNTHDTIGNFLRMRYMDDIFAIGGAGHASCVTNTMAPKFYGGDCILEEARADEFVGLQIRDTVEHGMVVNVQNRRYNRREASENIIEKSIIEGKPLKIKRLMHGKSNTSKRMKRGALLGCLLRLVDNSYGPQNLRDMDIMLQCQ